MTQKQEKTPLTKTWINVHQNFLQQFDTQTKTSYSSRNEAIRHGMKLVLKEITKYRANKAALNPGYNTPLTATNNKPKEQATCE